jgi:beta-lactamase class A
MLNPESSFFHRLFLPLLALLFASPVAEAAIDSSLEGQVEHYIKSLRRQGVLGGNERTAWVVQDLTSGKKLVTINENSSMQAASMIKPYLALAFFHQVQAGRIIYGSKSRRHLELMIQKSNNTSTNWVMQQTGGPAATEALLKRHYPSYCRQLRIVEYIPSGGKTYRNRGSAADYARFLEALWKRQLPSSSEILRLMSLPGIDRLYTDAKCVPSGTRVYNKTGSTAMCCGDMGILVARGKDGRSYPYILVGIIDSASRTRSYGTWISRRADVIREVSNLTYLGMKTYHPL